MKKDSEYKSRQITCKLRAYKTTREKLHKIVEILGENNTIQDILEDLTNERLRSLTKKCG